MAAMALARAPDVFQVGVAGAPVTSWYGYDTHYTERYMGTPAENAEGYARSAVMTHVDNIQGALLLVHGLIDENVPPPSLPYKVDTSRPSLRTNWTRLVPFAQVHFRHTARLINALIRAQKHYELLLFPDERHSPRSLKDRVFMEQRIHSFIQRTLGSAAPKQ